MWYNIFVNKNFPMIKTKIKNYTLFSLFLIVLNTIYFYIYFLLLDSSVTLLSILFLLFGVLSYTLFIHFFRGLVWEIINYLLIGLYFLFTLVNFAYFKIFDTFTSLKGTGVEQINTSLLSLLSDYFFLVPISLYLFSLITFVAIVFTIKKYDTKREAAKGEVLFQNTTILYKNKRNWAVLALIVVAFVGVNLLAFWWTNYTAQRPKDSWWNVSEQTIDLGIWGHVYNTLLAKNLNNKTPLINTNFLEKSEYIEANNLAKTKLLYQEIKKLSQTSSTQELPKLTDKPNVIVIQLESIGQFALDNEPSVMPFLKSLMETHPTVKNFYANSCETINAEFSTLCSFWPDSYEPIPYSHLDKDYYCLPQVLQERYGYETYFFHANEPEFWRRDVLAPKWGFNNIFQTPPIKKKAYDGVVLDKMLTLTQAEDKPYFAYVVTFNSHSPHNQELIDYHKQTNGFTITPFQGSINDNFDSIEIDEETLRNYFGFLKSTDDMLKDFFAKAEKLGVLDNTIILLHNDHRYYNFTDGTLEDFYLYNRLPMTMIFPGDNNVNFPNVASHIDLAPTLLQMVEQENYNQPDNFIGTSLFDENFKPQAVNKCLSNVYFVDEKSIIQGNAKTEQYTFSLTPDNFQDEQKQYWQGFFNELIKVSDDTLFGNEIKKTE